jgi:hypothetical protein
MSKHKKKKQNKEQLEKIAKAQAKNEFLRRLKKVLAVIGCEPVYEMLSQHTINFMFDHRFPSLKVVGADENTFHTDDLKWFKKAVIHNLKTTMMDLDMGGPQMDVYTFSTVGMTLKLFVDKIITQDIPKHTEYHEILRRYFESKEQISNNINALFDVTEFICPLISDIRTRIYWTDNKSELIKEKVRLETIIKIHGDIPEKRNFIINRELHSAIRIGLPLDSKPAWASVKPESLGLRSIGEYNMVDVYIQEHALNRLIERNDCVFIQYIMAELNLAVYTCKYHIDEINGKYMIEFSVFDHKTGYLMAEVVDTKLVIRTFLFLTNDGTPEGRKLHANTGLSKADKEYLKIDKLSTFLSPDIHGNEKIRKIFYDAGCGSLFKLKADFDERNFMIKKPTSASLIEDYLMLNEKKAAGFNWEEEEGRMK